MQRSRPISLGIICWVSIFFSFLQTPALFAYSLILSPELTGGSRALYHGIFIFTVIYSILIPFAAYFMLQAKNWARWLYVGLVLLDVALIVLSFVVQEPVGIAAIIRTALTVPIVFMIVFQRASNRYFSKRRRSSDYDE
jgi:hypothetical protein